jgi:hypothetical protein
MGKWFAHGIYCPPESNGYPQCGQPFVWPDSVLIWSAATYHRFPTPRHVAVFQSADLSAHSKFGHYLLPDRNIIAAWWGECPRESRFMFNIGLPTVCSTVAANRTIIMGGSGRIFNIRSVAVPGHSDLRRNRDLLSDPWETTTVAAPEDGRTPNAAVWNFIDTP